MGNLVCNGIELFPYRRDGIYLRKRSRGEFGIVLSKENNPLRSFSIADLISVDHFESDQNLFFSEIREVYFTASAWHRDSK